MRVQPTKGPRGDAPRLRWFIPGALWVCATLAGSIFYLVLLQPPLGNDLFWPYYNVSGYQTFLTDALNTVLETAPDETIVDLSLVTLEARYDGVLPNAIVHPTYAMALLTTKLRSLDFAITSLRNTSIDSIQLLPTQYCWVDFDKVFELAHTVTRQERCRRRYAANAAVYLESVFRNMDWDAFAAKYSGPNSNFWFAIQSGLEASPRGVHWMETIASVSTSVAEEVAYWQHAGIESFRYMWQDNHLPGLVETATLRNALNISTSLTLKSIEHSQGPGLSNSFYEPLLMDIFIVGMSNMSLIRGAPNYFLNTSYYGLPPQQFESITFAPYMFSANQVSLIHAALGPLFSIDLLVVPPPVALVSLTRALSAAFYRDLDRSSATTYAQLQRLSVSPTPPTWKSGQYVFYGGSVMCSYDTSQTFLQPPFMATDSCNVQTLWTVSVAPLAMVSALSLVNDSVKDICALAASDECEPSLYQAQTLGQRALNQTLVLDAIAAITALDVSLVQVASDVNETSYSLLRQPLLDPSPFAFFGWVLLFDWVAGVREVVSFEGDNGTLVLISDAYDSTPSTSSSSSSLSHASAGVYYIVAYSSLVLGAVAVTTLIASAVSHGAVSGSNFFVFNRIAGSTWLGRPLLLLRGASALVLLSSAPIGLDRVHNIYAHLVLSTRPLLETCFLAWEATWIGYVVHELLLPLQSHRARAIGLLGTSLTWLALVIIDVGWPLNVTATIDRKCTISVIYYNVRCNSVTLMTGQLSRLQLVGLLQCVFIPCLWLLNCITSRATLRETKRCHASSMLSVVGQAFLNRHSELDSVGRLASGLIPLGGSAIFDLKLWRLLFVSPTAAMVMPMEPDPSMIRKRWGPRVWVVFGTVYVITAIYSSVSYLGLAQRILTNDLIWPSFNMTGSHSFLANYFNKHVLGSKGSAIPLTNNQQINALGLFNLSQASVAFPIQQGASVQYSTLTALSDAISGLRMLDGCDGPWVFTPYCYLDFDQKWEMANSVKRQERCKAMVHNGAIFLASLLRNVDITTCWSESFEIGLASELRESKAGQALLASFHPPYLSIDDEVAVWTQKRITSYVLQWQNYKSIGLLHSYTIVNAYGASYPFTLQSTAGYYRMESQTSFKMYWSLANDLSGLLKNTSTMGGQSLLRSSSRFAYRNASLQDVLVTAKVLPVLPWSANYVVLSSYLGPFGSIDTVYISVPSVLQDAIAAFDTAVAGARMLNATSYLDIPDKYYSFPAPTQWKKTIYTVSGSILCPDQPSTYLETLEWILGADAYQGSCVDPYAPVLTFVPPRDHILFGVLLAGIDAATNVTSICLLESHSDGQHCETKIRAGLAFLPYLAALPNWRPPLYAAIHALNIEWVQFGMVNKTAPIELFHTPLLNPSDPSFDFFAWLFLFDWAIGNREVISFQGDLHTLTVMGNELTRLEQTVDSAQLPTVFALYALQAVRYVTYVMIMLAAVTFVYILLARGHVEGLNMFEMSRVGGIVWGGRPLVAVRSITALCLLSTASVELQSDGVLSYFVPTPIPLWTTCLAANEVTWLVGVVNDISLVWTQDHTIAYATINSLVMWLISALLATLAPVQATIIVSPTCMIATLDYQVVCVAGSVVIGSLERLLTLVGTVLVCNGVCFGLVRWLWKSGPKRLSSSILLCGGAKYLFEHHDWVLGDVYHLDRASAVLNGLLSVRYQSQWIIFDVKTWCVHTMEVASDLRVRTCENIVLVDRRFGLALPLRE